MTKTALFGCFRARIWKLKTIAIFEITIYWSEKFRAKRKILTFGTKNTLFGYFEAEVLENYPHIWNEGCQIAKFCANLK